MRLLYPLDKGWYKPNTRKRTKKVRFTVLPAQGRTRSSRDILARIGVIESPECWWCKETVQSVGHLYTRCRRWRKERRKLVRELEKDGVLWQAQAERRWLADLLANEKAVAPLLRFLKATGVGGREGARERELEWGRKNDQAGEDLLG